MRALPTALLCMAPVLSCTLSPHSLAQRWEDQVLPIELTVGYAVRAIDMNGDRKLDIAIVDSKQIVWLENPTWTAHTIDQTPDGQADNVCFAPLDIDDDGDLDLAIGGDWQPNNTTSGGSLAWLEAPSDPTQRWTRHAIADDLPTLHRMQWADIDADQQMELIVVPLKGRASQPPGWDDQPVAVTRWNPPATPASSPWKSEIIESTLPVMHNFQPIDFDGDRRHDLLLASFEGVHLWTQPDPNQPRELVHLGVGHAGAAPAKGASEIRIGFLSKSQRFLATIEPWHGNQVVVYEQPSGDQPLAETPWPRKILDNQLQWGHAVACANLDQDAEDELVIGVRDNLESHRCGVRIYDRQPDGSWSRSLVAPGQVAVEDLTVADLDGDGRQEIIAVGRATHNAVIYRQVP